MTTPPPSKTNKTHGGFFAEGLAEMTMSVKDQLTGSDRPRSVESEQAYKHR